MPTQTLGKVKLTPRGAYDPAATYVPLDIVSYGGGSYCVLKNVTGVTPTGDDVNYQLLAESGADGKSPQISASKTWLVWDADAGEYVDSGVSAAGEIPEVDDTLTQPGQAADAAAVGDRLSALSEEIASITGVPLVEPADDDIPKVFIDGEIPTTKTEVLAEMKYISKSKEFHAYIKIKCQGASSMSYPKKNFSVKLYSDEARATALTQTFRDWGYASNKFVLKANYIDHSHARNIVSANLWSEIVGIRSDYASLPEEMRTSPRNGAVDGFPIKVYANGTYQGVYTWNIGKDAWMWGMDESNANHVLLCGETNTDGTYAENACNFRALWSGADGTNWSIEVGTNSTAVKNSLNALISCVMNTTDDEFRTQIGTYLDLQSAIDYYLFQYAICGLDGLAKNMLLATYDLTKWYCGAYDLDSTFGLWWNGDRFVSTQYQCPEQYQEQFSLLWERIETVFYSELKARYTELRSGPLSLPNIYTHFERFMDTIGLDLYAEDLTIYTAIPSGSSNNIKQIRDYIRDRLAYVDEQIAALDAPAEEIPCTGITLDQTELTFTETGSQTLIATVEPSDTTESIVWESSDTSIVTVKNGVVTPVANGSANVKATAGSVSATCFVTVSAFDLSKHTIKLNTIGLWKETGLDSSITSWKTSDIMPLPTGFSYDTITVNDTSVNTIIDVFDADQNFVKEYAGRPATCVLQDVHYYAVAKESTSANELEVQFTETYPGAMKIPVNKKGLYKSTGFDSSDPQWTTGEIVELPTDMDEGTIQFADGVSDGRIIDTFDADKNFIKEHAYVSSVTFDSTVKYFAVACMGKAQISLQGKALALFVNIS